MSAVPQWFFLVVLGLFGLVFGSFANVVIWRFPRGESLSAPASHCPRCSIPIAPYDNIPVVSWLLLGGKCRSCKEPISARYPLVEVLSAVLWLLAGVTFGATTRVVFAVALFYLLMILSFIDLDHLRLPNKLVLILAVIGLIGVALSVLTGTQVLPFMGEMPVGALTDPIITAALGVLLGAGPIFLLAWAYRALRGRSGLGMGDVKLLAVLGIYEGPYVLLALMVGSILGVVFGLLGTKGEDKLKRQIPFGPFLAVGAIVAATVGPSLWIWYLGLAGVVR